MPTDAQEQAALIERILSTPAFIKAPLRKALLRFLFENTERFTDGKEIARKVFEIPDKDYAYDAGRVRERCLDLRTALEQYEDEREAIWRCRLPDAVRGEGYRLEFAKIKRKYSATELFWRPHLDAPQRLLVVCNSHLFFHNPAQFSSLRFYDTNTEGDSDEALAALKLKHPEAYKPELEASRVYLSAGEVNAFEALQRWFHERTGSLIQRRISRDMASRDILNSSPILLGRPDANKFIRRILNSPEAAHLGYRFHKPLGAVKIDAPREQEMRALSRFPFTAEGILGPVPKWEMVFGIATRLPNPSGQGAVTIISADYYATVITQIADALTSEDQAARLLAQMNRSADTPLPDSFEMLFAVRLSPGSMEGEGHAELLAWRM